MEDKIYSLGKKFYITVKDLPSEASFSLEATRIFASKEKGANVVISYKSCAAHQFSSIDHALCEAFQCEFDDLYTDEYHYSEMWNYLENSAKEIIAEAAGHGGT